MKGRVKIKIGKETYSFHFGLWVIERLELAFNAQLVEMYDTGEKDEDGSPVLASRFLQAITHQPYRFNAELLYWGRYFVYELEEKDVDFSIADAYTWIDEIGLNSDEMKKVSDCFNESLQSHLPKVEEKPEVKKK